MSDPTQKAGGTDSSASVQPQSVDPHTPVAQPVLKPQAPDPILASEQMRAAHVASSKTAPGTDNFLSSIFSAQSPMGVSSLPDLPTHETMLEHDSFFSQFLAGHFKTVQSLDDIKRRVAWLRPMVDFFEHSYEQVRANRPREFISLQVAQAETQGLLEAGQDFKSVKPFLLRLQAECTRLVSSILDLDQEMFLRSIFLGTLGDKMFSRAVASPELDDADYDPLPQLRSSASAASAVDGVKREWAPPNFWENPGEALIFLIIQNFFDLPSYEAETIQSRNILLTQLGEGLDLIASAEAAVPLAAMKAKLAESLTLIPADINHAVKAVYEAQAFLRKALAKILSIDINDLYWQARKGPKNAVEQSQHALFLLNQALAKKDRTLVEKVAHQLGSSIHVFLVSGPPDDLAPPFFSPLSSPKPEAPTYTVQSVQEIETLIVRHRANLKIIIQNPSAIDFAQLALKIERLQFPLSTQLLRMSNRIPYHNITVEDESGKVFLEYDDQGRLANSPSVLPDLEVPIPAKWANGHSAKLKVHDVGIIGGGPAGLSTAFELKLRKVTDVKIFESGKRALSRIEELYGMEKAFRKQYGGRYEPPEGVIALENSTTPELLRRFYSFQHYAHLNLELDSRIVDVTEENGIYFTLRKNGEIEAFHYLVAAMGGYGSATKIDAFANTTDLQILNRIIYDNSAEVVEQTTGKTIAVYGGGETAFNRVETAIAKGNNAILIYRGDDLYKYLSEESVAELLAYQKAEKLKIHLDSTIESGEILQDGNQPEAFQINIAKPQPAEAKADYVISSTFFEGVVGPLLYRAGTARSADFMDGTSPEVLKELITSESKKQIAFHEPSGKLFDLIAELYWLNEKKPPKQRNKIIVYTHMDCVSYRKYLKQDDPYAQKLLEALYAEKDALKKGEDSQGQEKGEKPEFYFIHNRWLKLGTVPAEDGFHKPAIVETVLQAPTANVNADILVAAIGYEKERPPKILENIGVQSIKKILAYDAKGNRIERIKSPGDTDRSSAVQPSSNQGKHAAVEIYEGLMGMKAAFRTSQPEIGSDGYERDQAVKGDTPLDENPNAGKEWIHTSASEPGQTSFSDFTVLGSRNFSNPLQTMGMHKTFLIQSTGNTATKTELKPEPRRLSQAQRYSRRAKRTRTARSSAIRARARSRQRSAAVRSRALARKSIRRSIRARA